MAEIFPSTPSPLFLNSYNGLIGSLDCYLKGEAAKRVPVYDTGYSRKSSQSQENNMNRQSIYCTTSTFV